jgi:hypothetical protein
VADDLRIRTPYSRAVVQEMRAVPWAWWDGDLKAWQVPFRSWEELLKRWPTIEAAAQRHASGERKKRQQARIGSPEHREAVARAAERRRRRYPVPDDPLPPLDRVVMTTAGAVIFTEVTGELADSDTAARFTRRSRRRAFRWCGNLAKPTLKELIKAWPARRQPDLRDRACGWWQLSIDELRAKRRAAASRERALQKARAAATASLREPIGPSSPLGGHPPGARGAKN